MGRVPCDGEIRMRVVQMTEKSELVADMGCKRGDVLRVHVESFRVVYFLATEVRLERLSEDDSLHPVLAGHLMVPFESEYGMCPERCAGLVFIPLTCREGAVWDDADDDDLLVPEFVQTDGFCIPLRLPSTYVEKVGRVTKERVFTRLNQESLAVLMGNKIIPSAEQEKRMFIKEVEWLPLARKMWDIVAGK